MSGLDSSKPYTTPHDSRSPSKSAQKWKVVAADDGASMRSTSTYSSLKGLLPGRSSKKEKEVRSGKSEAEQAR